jgi:alpha-maltose-1-phosphate synthase
MRIRLPRRRMPSPRDEVRAPAGVGTPNRPLKVLFINENLGGHGTVHVNLAQALAGRDEIRAEFLTVPRPGILRRLGSAPLPGLGRLDLDLKPLRSQLGISAWVRRQLRQTADGFDVIHLYTHNAGLLSSATFRRIPTVVTLDSTNVQNSRRLPYRRPTRFTRFTVAATRPFEQRVYAAAFTVVANSEYTAKSLRESYGVPEHKLVVLPFGILAPQFDSPAAPGTTSNELPRVVFVGHGMERKGGNLLLDLHRRLWSDRFELVLVVTDVRPGDGRLWSILRSAAVFVFPSEIDQVPNAVMEAMAAGLPVVAVSTGAVPEMVEEGVNGLLIDHAQAAPLTVAIEQLLANPAEREAMGAAGRKRFEAHFDMNLAVDRLVGLLADAARSNAGPE